MNINSNDTMPTLKKTSFSKGWFFAVPAIVFLLVRLWITFNTIIVSVTDFRHGVGIFGSPFIGFAHYEWIFDMPGFWSAIRNSFILVTLPVIFTSVVAGIFVFCIANLPKKWMKYLALTIIAIPAFIPAVAFASLMREFLPSGMLLRPMLYPFIFSLMDILRNALIPTIIGLLAYNAHQKKAFGVLIALTIYALFRLIFMFTPDFELVFLTYSVPIYETADVLDTFMFRLMMQGSFSTTSAVWVVRTLIQLIPAAGAWVGIHFLSKKFKTADKIDCRDNGDSNYSGKNSPTSSVLAIIGFLILSIPFIWIAVRMFPIFSPNMWSAMPILFSFPEIGIGVLNSFIYSLGGGLIFAGFALITAYPLVFKTKWYPLILLLTLLLGNNLIGEHLFLSGWLLGTPFVIWGSVGISTIGAFALYFAVRNKLSSANTLNTPPKFQEYFKLTYKPSIFLGLIVFALSRGGVLSEIIYLSERNYGIDLVAFFTFTAAGARDYSLPYFMRRTFGLAEALRFIVSIVPVTIGITLIWLDAFLKTPILSLFTANVKR